MTTTYVAIHVITTIDACGYIARRLVTDRAEAREVIQQLEDTNIYQSIRYSKEILTGRKLVAWNAYLAEKIIKKLFKNPLTKEPNGDII